MFCSVYPRVQYMSTACISRDPGNVNHMLTRPYAIGFIGWSCDYLLLLRIDDLTITGNFSDLS